MDNRLWAYVTDLVRIPEFRKATIELMPSGRSVIIDAPGCPYMDGALALGQAIQRCLEGVAPKVNGNPVAYLCINAAGNISELYFIAHDSVMSVQVLVTHDGPTHYRQYSDYRWGAWHAWRRS